MSLVLVGRISDCLSDLCLHRLRQNRNSTINKRKPPTSPTVRPTISPTLEPAEVEEDCTSGDDTLGRSSADLLTHWEGGHWPQFCIVVKEQILSLEQEGVHTAIHPVG